MLRGGAHGLLAALVVVTALWLLRGYADASLWRVAVLLAAVGGVTGVLVAAWRARRRTAAAVLEAAVPGSRNTIFTAAELIDARVDAADGAIRNAVIADAARLLAVADVRSIVPVRRGVVELGIVVAAWVSLAALAGEQPDALPELLVAGRETPRIFGMEVVVVPPPWIGGDPVREVGPERIEAVVGSRIMLTVRAVATAVHMERAAGALEMTGTGTRTFSAEFVVDGDDFVAVEPVTAEAAGVRRFIAIRARPDAAPQVRIAAPARDMVLPHADSVILVDVEATDDHAIASLALRYTRVTGFGEQFTFTDGEVPLEIVRSSADRWQAQARWPLRGLELGRGDMVVYRAIATDRKPGSTPAESDTYMIEIGDANVAAAGGFSTDEDPDRYALSQQMIIVLTERLLERRTALAAAEFATEAQVLAAAQRRIRAEYVFMLGGELGGEHEEEEHDMMELHEEAHARADLDVLEGRVANRGRQELVRAIQSMSHAARLLNDGEVDDALRAEQTALIFLQRAFSRSRYILRALTERERIDLDRRLTGSLAGVATQRRPQREEAADSTTLALRRAVSDAALLLSSRVAGPEAAARATSIARHLVSSTVLSVSETARAAASRFGDAANAFATGRTSEAQRAIGEAMQLLSEDLRKRLRPVPAVESAALRQLEGSVVDALRRSR